MHTYIHQERATKLRKTDSAESAQSKTSEDQLNEAMQLSQVSHQADVMMRREWVMNDATNELIEVEESLPLDEEVTSMEVATSIGYENAERERTVLASRLEVHSEPSDSLNVEVGSPTRSSVMSDAPRTPVPASITPVVLPACETQSQTQQNITDPIVRSLLLDDI
jgi:hypothetical protein